MIASDTICEPDLKEFQKKYKKDLYPFIGFRTLINNDRSADSFKMFFYEKQKESGCHYNNDNMCCVHSMF